jgi:hypothetical protein
MQERVVTIVILAGAIVGMFWTATANGQQLSQPKGGPNGSWVLIGQTQASHSADHDSITVVGRHDNFHRLKFKVTGAPLHMQRMVVTYDSGSPERIDVRQEIKQGGESRVIDLKGGKRSIRIIEFWYDAKGFLTGKADVTVFGMH